MSNSIIPPLLSDSPPPIATNLDEDYDDEFGDFRGPGDLSFENDVSTPSTPKNSKHFVEEYSPFELNEIENNFEPNRKTDDKSTKNFIRNELPTKNYINILDHIENNSQKIVNRDKEDLVNLNNEAKEELKDPSPVKWLDQSRCVENNEDNFPKNSILTKTFEEVKGNVKDQSVDSVLIITCNNSTEKSDSTDISDENDVKNKRDNISNFSEVTAKQFLPIADEIFHDSKDYFEDSSVFRSVNANENNDFSVKKEKPKLEDELKQASHIDDNSVDNFNYEESLAHLSKDEKTAPDVESETLNSSSSSTFSQDNFDTTEAEPNSEILDNGNELGYHKNTSHNLKKEREEIHAINTNNTMLYKNEHLHENLKKTEMENSQLDDCETAESNEHDDFGEFADFKTSNFESNTNVFDVHFKVEDIERDNDEFGNFENCEQSIKFNDLENAHKVVDKSEQDKMESKQGGITDDQLDEFDDFADYSTFTTPKDAADDDFDDFSDYSKFNRQNSDNREVCENTIQICKGPEEAFKLTQDVMEELFMPTISDMTDYTSSEITVGNSVFENLKDITETNALRYQWEKSTAQKNILKTLNIDIRNILYGPTWNSGIPIFAANLCSTPLEPIKSEVVYSLSPNKVLETPESNRSNVSTDVPVAEFDWNGAGLTNPLDYSPTMLLDLGELIVDCSILVSQDWEQSDSPTAFEDWESLGLSFEKQLETSDLSTSASDEIRSPSVNSIAIPSKLTDHENNTSDKSLQLLQCTNGASNSEGVEQNVVNDDDFSDFSSYQPNYEEGIEWSGKMLPLRESHISYQPSSIAEKSFSPQAIIKPSIESSMSTLNFDLSFRQSKPDTITSSETAHVISLSTPDYSDLKLFSETEDAFKIKESLTLFDDFKSFKTESNLQQQDTSPHCAIQSSASTVNIPDKTLVMVSQNAHVISKFAGTSPEELYSNKSIPRDSKYEDEFTDFRSASSNQPKLPLSSTLSFPEPLKPAVLQPVSVNNLSIAKIQWPEPGLDEHEINRIVAGCIRRKSETETRTQKTEPISCAEENISTKKVFNPQKSVTSNDDDEWTDFVSVKEPVKSRTATPDLPLSVFNLGTIQPVKAPTPVVTQNGLICSPVKHPLSNMSVPKPNFNLQRNIQHLPRKHPFITSQAFDELYQNPRENINNSFRESPRQVANQPCSNCGDRSKNTIDRYFDKTSQSASNIGYVPSQNGAISYGKFQSSSFGVPKSGGDDDEWGDFVSATNAVTPYSFNPNPLHSATRIISNPSHFMRAFNQKVSSEQYSSSNRGSVVRQERQNIPSISALPDLDFVSPRTKNLKK